MTGYYGAAGYYETDVFLPRGELSTRAKLISESYARVGTLGVYASPWAPSAPLEVPMHERHNGVL